MNQYRIEKIATLIHATFSIYLYPNSEIETLAFDTRTLVSPGTTLFFAIRGKNNDGHRYLKEAYDKGVRNFVVDQGTKDDEWYAGAAINLLKVNNTTAALQALGGAHREEFNIPLVGITGSNGKTVVKEWLFQLLNPDFNIVRSPKSYNSQIGVPLSLWLIEPGNNFAIIEAGISQPGEMENLQKIIQPTIGIFTNIGEAHQARFDSLEQKAEEKLKLFKEVDLLIYCRDHSIIHTLIQQKLEQGYFNPEIKILDWSRQVPEATLYLENGRDLDHETELIAYFEGEQQHLTLNFKDAASIENFIHCYSLMLHLGYTGHTIQQRADKLHPVEMRLEIKAGMHGTTLINDSYNSDLTSLALALDTLNMQSQHRTKTLILSDIFESGKPAAILYSQVADMLNQKKIDKLVGIGRDISAHKDLFRVTSVFFETTEAFLDTSDPNDFRNEAILIKGSRAFGFEAIAARMQQKTHQTVLEINLNALVNNLNTYRSLLKPETKIMAMVKAFSYGSGSYEIANILQFHKVDYLAVAYADEGIYLREQGAQVPIMIMNPEESAFEAMIRHRLEPELYSFRVLDAFNDAVHEYHKGPEPVSIHLKLDTGMHRLGFEEADIYPLAEKLKNDTKLHISSIFTHLASADIPGHDDFTHGQAALFDRFSGIIQQTIPYPMLRHVLNSSGAARFPQYQYDMIRLGIGLYGIDPSASIQRRLEPVSALKTHISQIRHLRAGDSVGYSRKAMLEHDATVATIGIGYADGFPRKLGNQRFSVLVNGYEAPVIGNVCMDMSMIDLSGIPAHEGDEVLIFGPGKPIEQMAGALETISYEILTNVSQRVKRVYYRE